MLVDIKDRGMRISHKAQPKEKTARDLLDHKAGGLILLLDNRYSLESSKTRLRELNQQKFKVRSRHPVNLFRRKQTIPFVQPIKNI